MLSNFLIFSVCQGDNDAQDYYNTTTIIHEYGFEPVLGVYQGISEHSFIVPITEFCTVDSLCHEYNQECFLMCQDGEGFLIFPTGHKESIGFLKSHLERPASDHTELSDGTFITFEKE